MLVGCNGGSSDGTLGNWVKKNSFEGTPRGAAVGFVIGNKAYLGLGYNSDYEKGDPDVTNEGYRKDFWAYDPAIDSWTKVASFPGKGRVYAVGFSVNGKGYVGTGFDGDDKLKDFWEYDPVANKWTQKDDFIGVARIKAVGFSLKNYGYLGTGYGSDASDKNDFYKFDPAAAAGSQWTQVRTIGGEKRRGATAFTYNNKGYVCTGSNSSGKLTDMWEYDPDANTWAKKVSLTDNSDWTITRENASSFVMDTDGKAYVFLGSNSSSLKTCWEYDFAKDTWNSKSDFESSTREYAVSFYVGGKAIVATGQAGTYYFDDLCQFRPYEESNTDD